MNTVIDRKIEHLEEERLEIEESIESIRIQFDDKDQTDRDGRRLSYDDYQAWHNRAVHALVVIKQRLRVVNQMLLRLRSEVGLESGVCSLCQGPWPKESVGAEENAR